MDVDGTENVPKNALRGSELPISRGIQAEVTDGPLGETVVAGSVPAVRSPVSCERGDYSPKRHGGGSSFWADILAREMVTNKMP